MPRLLAVTLWLLLFAVPWLGPPTRPDLGPWVLGLLRGDWEGTEPWVVVHFQLMGIWPLLLGLQLRGWWRTRPVPAWPFSAGAFVVGAYALLPWFALRRPAPHQPRPRVDAVAPWLAGGAGLAAAALALYGVLAGSVVAWGAAFATDGFVWTMSFDFLALWATSVLLARETGGRWTWALVPVVGTATLLAARQDRSALTVR